MPVQTRAAARAALCATYTKKEISAANTLISLRCSCNSTEGNGVRKQQQTQQSTRPRRSCAKY